MKNNTNVDVLESSMLWLNQVNTKCNVKISKNNNNNNKLVNKEWLSV